MAASVPRPEALQGVGIRTEIRGSHAARVRRTAARLRRAARAVGLRWEELSKVHVLEPKKGNVVERPLVGNEGLLPGKKNEISLATS